MSIPLRGILARAGRMLPGPRGFALAGLWLGLWLGMNHEPRRTGIAADRAAIYRLVLDWAEKQAPGWTPVRRVANEAAIATYMTAASGPREYGWLLQDFPAARPETVADFTRGQRERAPLRGVLPRGRVLLIRPPASDADAPPWYALSNIGFDAERTQAIVYVSHVCGETCGSGDYVFLRRVGGRWRISEAFMAWIS